MATVDVVIVNWNTGSELARCLESIAALDTASVEVTRVSVVDNASKDGSADGLSHIPLPLTVQRNTVNRGFAAACNQGAAGSRAEFLLFLNPDTRVGGAALAAPVEFMRSPAGTGVGICGIRLVDNDGRPTTAAARYPSVRCLVGEATGLSRILPRLFPRHLLTAGETSASGPVDQVIGAFFLMRRDLFERLGGFDERFFVYFEEVDLAYRSAQAGFSSWLLATVTAVHYGGLSSDQVRARRLFYSIRSRLLYARKHFSAGSAALIFAVTLLVEPIVRLGHAIVRRRSLQAANEVLRAYGLLLADRPFLSRLP